MCSTCARACERPPHQTSRAAYVLPDQIQGGCLGISGKQIKLKDGADLKFLLPRKLWFLFIKKKCCSELIKHRYIWGKIQLLLDIEKNCHTRPVFQGNKQCPKLNLYCLKTFLFLCFMHNYYLNIWVDCAFDSMHRWDGYLIFRNCFFQPPESIMRIFWFVLKSRYIFFIMLSA